ncbi:MAG: cytidylate kinase-like family protein [Planctomycetes bacterium]|jgi:cytidylate kinase|nr:cytidylate kinase-like family protein [Planctomycetota bacterium]
MFSSERLTEALTRVHQHWNARRELPRNEDEEAVKFTIAISRETGTYGAAIARAVGDRLGWPVYDRELLQRIADDIGVHRALLDSVDEQQESWLKECITSLFAVHAVSQTVYFRRLVEALLSLSKHGDCVIVGRGATRALPLATTLRVRLVARLEHRIQAVQREHATSREEAAAQVEKKDRERNRFVASHFHIDPADPANYDLVLNTERLSTTECADLILATLECLRQNAKARLPALVPA